jgi:hypothetical protein
MAGRGRCCDIRSLLSVGDGYVGTERNAFPAAAII